MKYDFSQETANEMLEKADKKVSDALSEAVLVLYLDDDSDYCAALWKIVEILGGKEAVDMLEHNEADAYKTYVNSEDEDE